MNESDLQGVYKFPFYPRDSKTFSDRRIVIIENGSMGGTLWVCFYMKDNKSFNFDSFDGQPDHFFLHQLSNKNYIIIKSYKIWIPNYVDLLFLIFPYNWKTELLRCHFKNVFCLIKLDDKIIW